VWAPEHSHIPLTRKSEWPGGGELPKKYYDAMDPFVTLTAAAAATRNLKVGTGDCLVNQRDPIQTAKAVASIDQVSGGRFLFGVGNGWNQDEMENHGTDFESRHKLVRERIEAMKVIWTKSKAEYHGDMVKFDPMMAWPKPVQKPHPPVLVGGAFPYGARRAVRYGDGWMPLRRRKAYGEVRDLIPKFREMAKEANRDLASLPISIWESKEDEGELKRDQDAGVVRVIVSLDSAKSDVILPQLDRWAKLAAKVK
jgi:probable F420-dependent oxidoreductase